jgi:predicted acyl esterase
VLPKGEPVEVVFDLLTTARRFPAGHCIRITVGFADADDLDTPAEDRAPKLRLLRNRHYASFVDLPIAQQEK